MARIAHTVLALNFFLLAQAATSAQSATPPANGAPATGSAVRRPGPDYHPPDGFIYRYKAEWRLLNAGVVTLKMEHAADGTEHITGTADAIGVVARLYHVHDIFQSSFDPKTFCSSGITKHAEEGSRRRETTIRFDYQLGKAKVDELNANKNQRRHWENLIPACALDVLSAVYYVAATSLEPGSTFSFPINDGNKTGDLDVNVTGREQISVEGGTFKTIVVETEPSSEIMRNRGRAWVWFSDDAQRIPVKIRGKLRWGTVTLTLQSIERSKPAAAKP
jgi:hypothetical protein